MSKITNCPLAEIATFNLLYDLTADKQDQDSLKTKACTSIVVENTEGEIIHGRNLDYDPELLPIMRNVTVLLDWQRDGQTLYSSVSTLPIVGFHTFVKPG